MFCGKCGLKNDDDAYFCAGCGAELKPEQNVNAGTPVSTGSSNKNRKVGIIAVAVIAVIAVIVIVAAIAFLNGRADKSTVEKDVNTQTDADATVEKDVNTQTDADTDTDADAINAIVEQFVYAQLNADANAIFELFPENAKNINDRLDEMFYGRANATLDVWNEDLQKQLNYIESIFGTDWEASYEIVDVKDITGDDLDELEDEKSGIKPSSAKALTIRLTVVGGENSEYYGKSLLWDHYISLIKVENSWYLLPNSVGPSSIVE